VATAPRSTGARAVKVFTAIPERIAGLLPLVRATGPLAGLSPVKLLLERYIARLPEGPSDAERASARFAVLAEAWPPMGMPGCQIPQGVWVTGGDSYSFTAASAALCARLAAAAGFASRGALTPSQAFGARALLDGLFDGGVRWGSVRYQLTSRSVVGA
jgi:short subunit dehydrogenase-like uncharacterized protein